MARKNKFDYIHRENLRAWVNYESLTSLHTVYTRKKESKREVKEKLVRNVQGKLIEERESPE